MNLLDSQTGAPGGAAAFSPADAPATAVNTRPPAATPEPVTPPGTFSSKSEDEEGMADLFADTELYPYTKLSQRYDERARRLGYSLADR